MMLRAFVVVTALVTLAAGCSGRSADARRVVVRGSDTMVVVAQRWAEVYSKRPGGSRIEVSGGGSGTGIAALTNGTADIATASRAITASERALLERSGGVVEHVVALDAVAIYVNVESPVMELSIDEVRRIYHGDIDRWAELRGADRPVARYSRENSSGTYAFFKERVLGGADFASDTQCLPGTAAVVRAVARDPHAIGYGGIARASGVRALAIREASGVVSRPIKQDAVSGRYPLSRPLYVYLRSAATADAKAFVAWLEEAEARSLAEEGGFFAPPGRSS